jgi:hypothetical protein
LALNYGEAPTTIDIDNNRYHLARKEGAEKKKKKKKEDKA